MQDVIKLANLMYNTHLWGWTIKRLYRHFAKTWFIHAGGFSTFDVQHSFGNGGQTIKPLYRPFAKARFIHAGRRSTFNVQHSSEMVARQSSHCTGHLQTWFVHAGGHSTFKFNVQPVSEPGSLPRQLSRPTQAQDLTSAYG